MRQECLNEHPLFSMVYARTGVAGWVEDFNDARPDLAIGYMMLAAYSATLKPQRTSALRHLESSPPISVAITMPMLDSQLTTPVDDG